MTYYIYTLLKADKPIDFHGIRKTDVRCRYCIIPILPITILYQNKIVFLLTTQLSKLWSSKKDRF